MHALAVKYGGLPEQAGKDGEEGLAKVLEGGHSEVTVLWEDSGVHRLVTVVGNLCEEKKIEIL